MLRTASKGEQLITEDRPDLIITDMMMPKLGGFPVLEFLKTINDPPPVIMMTANEGGRHKAYAEMLGVVDYLRKPFAMDVLLESVTRALDPDAKAKGDPEARTPQTIDGEEEELRAAGGGVTGGPLPRSIRVGHTFLSVRMRSPSMNRHRQKCLCRPDVMRTFQNRS